MGEEAFAQTEVGQEFQIYTYTTNSRRSPPSPPTLQVTLVVVSQSDGSLGTDTSSYSRIQKKNFFAPFFFDGFESGDTSA